METSWTRCWTAIRLDQLADDKRKGQADGCTIASLLLMNAAMLHQRIAAGAWLPGISGLDAIKNAPDAITVVYSQWNRITATTSCPSSSLRSTSLRQCSSPADGQA